MGALTYVILKMASCKWLIGMLLVILIFLCCFAQALMASGFKTQASFNDKFFS